MRARSVVAIERAGSDAEHFGDLRQRGRRNSAIRPDARADRRLELAQRRINSTACSALASAAAGGLFGVRAAVKAMRWRLGVSAPIDQDRAHRAQRVKNCSGSANCGPSSSLILT
jgi:hypothetical protein